MTYPVAWSTTILPEVARNATERTQADQRAIRVIYIQNAWSMRKGIFATTTSGCKDNFIQLLGSLNLFVTLNVTGPLGEADQLADI